MRHQFRALFTYQEDAGRRDAPQAGDGIDIIPFDRRYERVQHLGRRKRG